MEGINLPHLNLALAAATALIPMIFGFVWYHPKLLGTSWMKEVGLTEESAKTNFNMPLVFGLSYLLSFFLAVFLHFWTIHQFAFMSLLEPARNYTNPPGFEDAIKAAANISATKFRSWSHGMAHGIVLGITLLLPLIATNGMFERKSWKYILINWGYWTICVTLMGMVICRFA